MSKVLAESSSIYVPTTWVRLLPWIVVFAAATFFFFEFMQINMFNSLDPYLFKAYHLTDSTQLGHLAANYNYANVLFLFPAGIILDRFSTRRVILVSMFACVSCTLLFASTQQLWQAEVCRFVTGIGGAFCLLSCVRLASRWFPAKQMALVIGLVVTFGMLGAMIAQTPFTIMASHYGWRETLVVDAMAGYVMLLLIFVFVKDHPPAENNHFQTQLHELNDLGVGKAISGALSNPQNWFAGIFASLTNLPVFLLGSWGVMYLHQIHGLSRESGSVITSALFLGLIVGSPMFGWISDRLRRRRPVMIFGAILCLISILPVMFWSSASYVDLLILFFFVGVASSSQIIAYPVVAESNPEYLTASSEAVASVLIMSGGFFIPIFARLLDVSWQHHFINGLPIYSDHSFHLAFTIMPIAFVASLIAAMMLKETYCQSFTERNTHA